MKAEIHNFSAWLNNTEPDFLKDVLEKALIKSGHNIINFTEHFFSPKGYTCIWLLAESHLAVHTFPEENKSYIELSSCNKEKTDFFKNNIKSLQSE